MNATPQADVAVLIGRFQPFHNGHAGLLKRALASAPKVLVVLGSCFQARNAKNPFSGAERAAMIAATLAPHERERVMFAEVRDHYDDGLWAGSVREQLRLQAPGAARIALVGHFKDASSYYLNHFPQWQLIAEAPEFDIDATAIRRILFEAEEMDVSMAVLAELVPAAVRQYLKAWSALPQFAALVQEHAQVLRYKAAWKNAPYAPIFSTVDAVVRTAGHLLLIRRGGFPGKGLWALPGGFVEPRERLLQGAIRELSEETRLGVLPETLEQALRGVKVFDHPDRSQRGRTITHAHFFDLGLDHLPSIEADDDAQLAQWVPVERLLAMELEFFEDHLHIIDSFLKLSGGAA